MKKKISTIPHVMQNIAFANQTRKHMEFSHFIFLEKSKNNKNFALSQQHAGTSKLK